MLLENVQKMLYRAMLMLKRNFCWGICFTGTLIEVCIKVENCILCLKKEPNTIILNDKYYIFSIVYLNSTCINLA